MQGKCPLGAEQAACERQGRRPKVEKTKSWTDMRGNSCGVKRETRCHERVKNFGPKGKARDRGAAVAKWGSERESRRLEMSVKQFRTTGRRTAPHSGLFFSPFFAFGMRPVNVLRQAKTLSGEGGEPKKLFRMARDTISYVEDGT